jgi:hypothetical protein
MRARSASFAAVAFGVLLSVPAWAGAVPKPPPEFWSAGRCDRLLLGTYGGPTFGHPLPTGHGHWFHVGQVICVGSGGPRACRWTTAHRRRLYSEFSVFARSRLNGGVVRTWTLATRAAADFVAVRHRFGDRYVGWPADFYMSRVTLLGTGATAARFRSIAAPLAARVARQERTTGCSG